MHNKINTFENTKLIAEFMGYKIIKYNDTDNTIYNGNKYAKTIGEQKELWGGLELQFTGRFVYKVDFPFNTDWNYLMPVIAKIEQSGYVVKICGISCNIYTVIDSLDGEPLVSWVCGDVTKKIGLVYDAVIQFLTLLKTLK